MKQILCFGDSNTWGLDPSGDINEVSRRFPADMRWSGLLQVALGANAHVHEAGHCGRTTAFDDSLVPNCNGLALLPAFLECTRPLDLVIFMLGTNDVKRRIGVTTMDISRGMEALVQCVRSYSCGEKSGDVPAILIVAPAELRPELLATQTGEFFGTAGLEQSRQLALYYEALARRCGCAFVNAGDFAQASCVDGIHLDGENHRKLAEGLLPAVRSLL